MKKNNNGFTLVELIIVITILVILSTIAFLNFGNYTGKSRDLIRLSDLKNIEKALILNKIESGVYPIPEDSQNDFKIEGISQINWIKGKFGEQQSIELKRLNNLPLDPLTKEKYDYYISSDKKYYRLEFIKEENNEKLFISNYFLDLNVAPTFEVVNSKLGNENIYYIQSNNNLKWSNISSSSYSISLNNSYDVPVWNGEEYNLPTGRTIADYPAFKFCRDKGVLWRLPTKNELISIINYNQKNSNKSYTNHPNITSVNSDGNEINIFYYTSTSYDLNNQYSWIVKFNNFGDILVGNAASKKTNAHKVVCVHD